MTKEICSVDVPKDLFVENLFEKTIIRMGWTLIDAGDKWIVKYPKAENALFDFVFGV